MPLTLLCAPRALLSVGREELEHATGRSERQLGRAQGDKKDHHDRSAQSPTSRRAQEQAQSQVIDLKHAPAPRSVLAPARASSARSIGISAAVHRSCTAIESACSEVARARRRTNGVYRCRCEEVGYLSARASCMRVRVSHVSERVNYPVHANSDDKRAARQQIRTPTTHDRAFMFPPTTRPRWGTSGSPRSARSAAPGSPRTQDRPGTRAAAPEGWCVYCLPGRQVDR